MRSISKSFKHTLLLTSATFAVLSTSTTSFAGFEWVPRKAQPAEMVVQDAPVPAVANEMLDMQPKVMMPAPNSGMMPTPTQQPNVEMSKTTHDMQTDKSTMKTMSFEQTESTAEEIVEENLQQPVALTPPANTQAQAITVKELEASEKEMDLPVMATKEAAPVDLMQQTNEPVVVEKMTQTVPDTSGMIEPFPIMTKQNKMVVKSNASEMMDTMEPVATPTPSIQMAEEPNMDTVTMPEKEVVAGFGKDMPLALALSQIIPDSYAYSFSSDVNPGVRINWNGGKSWDVVLGEALEALNLSAYYQDNKVTIYKGDYIAPEKTSSLDTNDAEAVLAIEPAAGTEAPVTNEMMEQVMKQPAPAKRMTIQDPGEVAPENEVSETVSPEKITMNIDTTSENVSISTPELINTPKWSAEKGDSLKKTLYMWSEKSNMQVIWEASHDYMLEEDFMFTGSYQEAFKALIDAQESKTDIHVRFIENSQNPDEISMLIVQDHEQAMKKKEQMEKAG